MLSVQVQYWTLQENKRHNIQTEKLGFQTLNETIRHNVVTEDETHRHNVATENYYQNSLSETIRHNTVTEQLGAEKNQIDWTNAFTNQRNAAANEMNAASNRMNAITQSRSVDNSYSLGLKANEISQQNADTNRINAETRENEYKLQWLNQFVGPASQQASASTRSAEAAYNNSLTNAYNAETNRGQLELGYDNLSFQESKWNQEYGLRKQQTMQDWIKTVAGSTKDISSIADTWYDNVLSH